MIYRQPFVYPKYLSVTNGVLKYYMLFNPKDYTTVFLSYDEPNCETNYQHLLTLCPNALRVHGVKGSDTAHKKVAELSQTENVIIVDGDNIVKSNFYNTTISLTQNTDLSTNVLSFSGYNNINGNCYGNGGIKIWPVQLLKDMKTHENSENSVDFNLSNYLELNRIGSDVIINSTPLQAFRSGLRESVKLSLDKEIDWRNYDRLWRWLHLGNDVKNGIWAIYGARYGYLQMLKGWDYTKINDVDYLISTFSDLYDMYRNYIEDECNRLGTLIRIKNNDKNIRNVLSVDDSITYKNNIPCLLRSPEDFIVDKSTIQYDIVFIDYENTGNKHSSFKYLQGTKNIQHDYVNAAKLCTTDYFWIVDGDVGSFKFDYKVNFYEQPKVRVWYGPGEIKLLPRMPTIRMNNDHIDPLNNISKHYEEYQYE